MSKRRAKSMGEPVLFPEAKEIRRFAAFDCIPGKNFPNQVSVTLVRREMLERAQYDGPIQPCVLFVGSNHQGRGGVIGFKMTLDLARAMCQSVVSAIDLELSGQRRSPLPRGEGQGEGSSNSHRAAASTPHHAGADALAAIAYHEIEADLPPPPPKRRGLPPANSSTQHHAVASAEPHAQARDSSSTSHHAAVFGDQVRAARKAAGLSQVELALKAGLVSQTISNIERGLGGSAATRLALQKALDLSGPARPTA